MQTACVSWEVEYGKGADAPADSLHRGFHSYLKTEMERLTEAGGEAGTPEALERVRAQIWAAFFLPIPLYKVFKRASLRDPFRYGGMHTVWAQKAAQEYRVFPIPPRPKPQLEVVGDRERRAEWRQSPPLLTYQDSPEAIRKAMAGFSADDLHEIAHGEDLSDAPLVEAVACHPACDWGSALEILHSFSADAYQKYWYEGRSPDEFGENDQTLFRTFAVIANRANRNDFRTRRFRHNYQMPEVRLPDGSVCIEHPSNWQMWRIEARNLLETEGQAHSPAVAFDGGKVLEGFDRWSRRQDDIAS